MRIDEVTIKRVDGDDKILAYCSIIVDGLAIHELKLIEADGKRFVSMPTRKLADRCRCGKKNQLQAFYCNWCGARLGADRYEVDASGRPMLYASIVHPIHNDVRRVIESAIGASYEAKS